jgi:hypothetical protein
MMSKSWHAERVKPTAIERWSRLTPPKRSLLIESAAALCVSSLAVKLLPFPLAIKMSSRPEGSSAADASLQVMSDVRWAIDAVTRGLPWNPVCIQRGLAAQWMLRRRGIDARLHYGLALDDQNGLRAHVWVDALGQTLVGGEGAGEYVRVATFP